MNRRGFFGLLAGIAATATTDPERLLWIPGQKLISIPNLPRIPGPEFVHLGDILTFGDDCERFIVTAEGPSFSDIRFRYLDRTAQIMQRLPREDLYHSELGRELAAWRIRRSRLCQFATEESL